MCVFHFLPLNQLYGSFSQGAQYDLDNNYNFGFYQPYELDKKTLQYNFNGGAEWMGGSVNHNKGIMYVTSNNILWETGITREEKNKSQIPTYSSNFKRALDKNGYPVIKPPWGSLTALNLNNGKIKSITGDRIILDTPAGNSSFSKKDDTADQVSKMASQAAKSGLDN